MSRIEQARRQVQQERAASPVGQGIYREVAQIVGRPSLEERQATEATNARWLAVGLPARHRREIDGGGYHAPEFAREYARHFTAGGSVVLLGSPGTGKTLLAAWIARNAVVSGMPVTYIKAPDLFERMRTEFDDDGEREGTALRRVAKTPLLIIDEFELDERSPWQKTQAARLIDDRWGGVLGTVFVSNLTPESLQKQIGDAAWSRLSGTWSRSRVMTGEDRRAKKVIT